MNAVEVNFYKIALLDVFECLIYRLDSKTFAGIVSRAIRNKRYRNSLFIASKHHSVDNFMQSSIASNSYQGTCLIC